MIEFIFTIDYELYGNGEGCLDELVLKPADKLSRIFRNAGCRFVSFIEVAEIEAIDSKQSDPAIDLVKKQIIDFHNDNFELGLHIHPQWCNAQYKDDKWLLDYNEYNLCTLPRERIVEIVDQCIGYLRKLLGEPNYIPISFRAGNWLMQPTSVVADVLTEKGIKLDSSVFKGGRQHKHGLDYRKAMGNDYYWAFSENINIPDSKGIMLEIPTYTKMVPFWKMLTMGRVAIKKQGASIGRSQSQWIERVPDFLRFTYPLKLDFCKMTYGELSIMLEEIIQEDLKDPSRYRPVVAIGHTKDLVNYETVESLLSLLKSKDIKVTTFKDVYQKIIN